MAYKHIGVAISGNEEDALLVNKALELARHNDAHLTLRDPLIISPKRNHV